MNDTPLSHETVDSIFSQLDAADVDQFYHGYQRWRFQRRIDALHEQIDALQQRIAANCEDMQRNAPSPMALASLARMQSRGVQDTDLLDRLLERGEEWLDRTIQRLEYCEQAGLIGDDYTKWCEHALEGAYDWIDSLTGANGAAPAGQPDTLAETDQQANASQLLPETTEAMLLQKLMSEEDDVTLKLPSVPATPVLPEATPAELPEVPAEQVVSEEPEGTAAPEAEIWAEHEAIQPAGDEQHNSEAEVAPLEESGAAIETQHSSEEEGTPPAENAAALTETAPESEQMVIPGESGEPDKIVQESSIEETNEPNDSVQANNAPAPSEQYDFPENFDELPHIAAEASPPQDHPSPSTEAAAPAIADVPTSVQPAAAPPARPPRKRNFLQKLIYVLIGK
jgi:hypothetical protein